MRTSLIVLLWLTGLSAISGQSAQTGSILGVVTTGADRRPVRLAIVTLMGQGFTFVRSTITDDAGRYAFAAVPAGRYTLRASKSAYITNTFGAIRAGRPGTPVTVAPGEQLRELNIDLPRGAVITGIVRDPAGHPAAGVTVSAVRSDTLTPAGVSMIPDRALTDDRGSYRVFGLTPGEYVVVAMPRVTGVGEMGAMSVAEVDAALREVQSGKTSGTSGRTGVSAAKPQSYDFANTYFPATAVPADATTLKLNAGDERQGIDIALQFVRTATVEGTVTSPDGGSFESLRVSIQSVAPTAGLRLDILQWMGTVPTVGGKFQFTSVVPGRYQIIARTEPDRGNASPPLLWAMAEVTVHGDDVSGIALMLRPGQRVTGKVVIDGEGANRPRPEDLRVTILPVPHVGPPVERALPGGPASATVSADGTFIVAGVLPGPYQPRLSSNTALKEWGLQSAMVNGRDALDHGLEVEERDVEMLLTFSNRYTELTGSLQTPEGRPATDFFVIVFPADRGLWRSGGRRVQTTRPDTAGRFAFRGLPAGDYQIAALTDVEPEDTNDPAFLAAMVPASVAVTLKVGESKRQGLRIRR